MYSSSYSISCLILFFFFPGCLLYYLFLQVGGRGVVSQSDDDRKSQRTVKRLTSPERFEIKQLIAAGVLKREEYPDFDEDTGK